MEIQISTQKTEVKAMVLVQGDAAVDMVLGTDLMASLGLCILDAEGQLLLGSASNMHRQFQASPGLHSPHQKHLLPCQRRGGRRHKSRQRKLTVVPGPNDQPEATVHLLQAYKLPARTGKVLKAKIHHPDSATPCLFEPDVSMHARALDIADAVVQPDDKCFVPLPVRNSSGCPVRLMKGEAVGRLLPMEQITKDLHRSR